MIQRTPAAIEARNVIATRDHSLSAPARTGADQAVSWQTLLSQSITRPEELLARLGLPADLLKGAEAGHRLFSIRVPEPFLARMTPGDPDDPLLRQVLPRLDETVTPAGYVTDPLEENGSVVASGLIRKYRSRALLMVTGQCAINCRYCFRRHFPYADHSLGPGDRQQALTFLEQNPEINEVIFSGGDPLAANDRLLAQWVSALESLPHLKRLRIHTRLPVVIPQRVCDELLAWLSGTRLQTVMVLHINHPAEVDADTRAALGRLRAAGVTLLNQSVILRGVNDCADTLCSLSEALFDAGVLPYYLHAFDPVAGAHHFDISDEQAAGLVRAMMATLPGFLVPRLVRECPGESGKSPIALLPAGL
ncbi:MAG TPA: EF-P beta-lysylation protein EpmB [Marinobacter sp.]|jgi:EF-P beta-lysylation protein EpmB|nr:EF-P beta-lysylation protein EpmB [Marinobacter sp.]